VRKRDKQVPLSHLVFTARRTLLTRRGLLRDRPRRPAAASFTGHNLGRCLRRKSSVERALRGALNRIWLWVLLPRSVFRKERSYVLNLRRRWQ
jgi:hypothetical protein